MTADSSWHIDLPHAPPAAPIARAAVRNALSELGSSVDGETAELLVCELVTNAIEHTPGGTAVELTVTELGEGLLVEVRDRDPRPLAGLPREDAGEGPSGDPPQADARPAGAAPGDPDAGSSVHEEADRALAEALEEVADAPGEGGTAPAPPSSPETLDVRALEDVAEDGRGLLLIRSLSTACGSRLGPDGKTVWFTLGPDEPDVSDASGGLDAPDASHGPDVPGGPDAPGAPDAREP
ncbi:MULTISPECIES: ATP-binding protein [Streptomyces]|uniref:Histidine kinase/HSP90-like ATPase domain-containing protein n=2 Tax=Streptomyces cacaoi TaxID=1898 RepID=A0A4Y3R6H9_STRCI|nr:MULTISPECIES: ATP-binding protein [Streptomyces]GEB52377.1 hypothetical protein SCA03_49280 [Streptomyces cacaoi]